MSKKNLLLTAIAGMLAASNGCDVSSMIGERAKKDTRTSNEKKKCKSCKHFCKISDGRCVCDIYARMDFPNGYGISVICGIQFYSNGKDTYEVGVFDEDILSATSPKTA